MRLNISHTTRYSYEQPTPSGLQQLRLTPQSGPGQAVMNWSTSVEGGQTEAEFHDHHDNLVTLVSVRAGGTEIIVRSSGVVETEDIAGVVGAHCGLTPLWYFRRATPLTTPGRRLKAMLDRLGGGSDVRDISALHTLSARILEVIRYEPGSTHSATTAEAALEAGAGVCQDHAHVFLAATRSLGFPARYVSGYLMMDGSIDQEAGHAWAEAHVPDLGWVGFDVSNGIAPDARYVRVATGLDFLEAAPITGLMHGLGNETMSVALQVQQ